MDRVFWVSETSCESETNEGDPDETNVHSCQRQTQQFLDPVSGVNEHGVGSLKFLETEDRVARVSWWTTLRVRNTHSNTRTPTRSSHVF